MKRKRPPTTNKNTQKDPQHSQDPSKPEVIDLDTEDPTATEKDNMIGPSSLKQSWVWNHFKDSSDSSVAICQVMIKSYMCGASLKKQRWADTLPKWIKLSVT